jgi:hypothetical protein
MTTPPTPAGWYPDPEQAGQLRYWDGGSWTEHRTPEQPSSEEPAEAAEPAQPAGGHVGAHRRPDPDPDPEPAQAQADPEPTQAQAPDHDPLPPTEQPTTKVPLREWSFEPPPLEPDVAPHGFSSEPQSSQEPTSTPPVPLTEQPTTKVPLRDWTAEPTPEPAPYADATTPTPAEPPEVEPPAGTEPTAPVDNRKLVMGFGGVIAALLLVLILAAVYAFVIHKDNKVALGSPSSSESSTSTSKETTSEAATSTEAATPPPESGAVDGPLTFTVTGVESGSTVTSSDNDFLTKTAQGEFIVVHLTVQNTSGDPGQFLGTLQKLKAGGQVYNIDDEATFYVGGGFVDIPAGGQADVGLAYDVPQGTVPETIELHADPMSPGIELPVG